MNKYNHLFSINEKYNKNNWGDSNNDNIVRKALRSTETIASYPGGFYTTSTISNHNNIANVLEMHRKLIENLKSNKSVTSYTFDIETLGNLKNGVTEIEKGLGNVTEFGLKSLELTYDGKNVSTNNYSTVSNITFGLDNKQQEYANQLVQMYDDILSGKAPKGKTLTSSELSSLKFLTKYGGENINIKSLSKKDGQFFGMRDGRVIILDHYVSPNEIDIDRVKTGIKNLNTISKHQGIGTEIGNTMFNELTTTLNNISANNSVLHGYNIHNFDIPFLKNFIDVTGKKIYGKDYVSPVDFSKIQTYDVFESMNVAIGNNYVRDTVKVANANGVDISLDKIATLGVQAEARGVEKFKAHIAVEDAPGTTEMFYKVQKDGNSVFSDVGKFIDKLKLFKIKQSDEGKVLKARSALRINQSDEKGVGLSSGKYDQYLEMDIDGDYKTVDYMSNSINSNTYYNLDSVELILKDDLIEKYPTIDFDFKEENDHIFKMVFTNASDLKANQAMIFRESLVEAQKVLSNFDIKTLVDDAELTLPHQVTKEQINLATKNKMLDNTRRKIASTRIAKENGYNKYTNNTSLERYQLAFERINQEFTNGTSLMSKSDLDDVFSSDLVTASRISDMLTEVFGNKYSEKEAFYNAYDYIKDNYNLNKKVLNVIKSNTKNGFSDNESRAYYQTMLYGKIMDKIENDLVEYNVNLTKLSGGDVNKVKDKVLNYKNIEDNIKEFEKIDLLSPINVNSNKKEFYSKPIEDRYFSVSGTHTNKVSNSIASKVNSITKNSPTKLTEIQEMKIKKSYINAMLKDLRKRGVINKDTYKEFKGYVSKAESNNGLFRFYNQLGNELVGVVDSAKNLEDKNISRYDALTVKDVKVKDISSNKINGKSFSNYVENILYPDTSIEKVANEVVEDFKSYSNVKYASNVVDADTFNDVGVGSWLKTNYGWSDEHVDHLKNILYSKTNGIANNQVGINKSVHFFTMKDKDGADLPLIGIANRNNNIMFEKDKLPDKMSYMFLPKLDTERVLYDYNKKEAVPGIVRLGNMDKLNIKRIQSYHKIQSNNAVTVHINEKDLVTRVLDTLSIMRNNIDESIEKGEYHSLTNSLNASSKRKIMNETGVSQKIISKGEDGLEKAIHKVSRIDMDNLNTVVMDDLINILPSLYEDSASNIRKSMHSAFGRDRADKLIGIKSGESRSIMKLASKKNLTLENLPADLSNWLLLNMYNVGDESVDGSYSGILKESYDYFTKNNDSRSANIIKNILDNGHSYIKDGNMTSLKSIVGDGIKATPLSVFTDPTRSVINQMQNAIPLMLDEMDYKKYENELGISFGRRLNTNSALNTYEKVMYQNGDRVATSFVGNVKQEKSGDAYLKYKKAMIDLNNKDLQVGDNILKNINQKFNTNYSRKDLNEALNVFMQRTSTYEGAGLFNPRMIGMLNTEQIYNMEVSEEFYNSVTRGGVVSKGQSLGINRKGQKLFHEKHDAIILGKEVLGFEDANVIDKDKKFILSYKFNKPTNNNTLKLGTFGYNEKGVFTTVDLGEKRNLGIGIFEELFGDVVAISQAELFKHQSYGGIVGSYFNTMIDSAIKFDNINGTNELGGLVNLLNKELPSMGFGIDYDPNTGNKVVTHLSASNITDSTKMPISAVENIISHYNGANTEFSKNLISTIDYMDKNMIFKTDISQMFLTDSYADRVKINDKAIQNMNMASTQDVVRKSRLQHREYARTTKQYKDAQQLLENIRTALMADEGKMIGVIEELDAKNFHFTGIEPSYLDLKKSKLFDFNATNEYGARINAYKVNLPDGLAIKNEYTGNIVDTAYLAVNKSHHVNANEALSELQKAQENFMLSLNKYYSNPNDLNNIKRIQDTYNEIYHKTQYEIFNKEGIVAQKMRGVEYSEGSMDLMTKAMAPEFIFELNNEILYNAPLDENGNLVKGTKVKGFIDSTFDVDLIFEDGNIVGLKDNYSFSEQALNSKGIYFDVFGEDILNGVKVEDEFNDVVIDARKNLATAIEVLNNATKENNKELIEDASKKVDEIYYNLGKQYMTDIGVYGEAMRHPIFKDTSYSAAKLKYNPVLQGNESMTNFNYVGSKAGDLDGDQSASRQYGNKKDKAVTHILDVNSQEYKNAENAYDYIARNRNMEVFNEYLVGYAKDYQEEKFFYEGLTKTPLELTKEKVKSVDEEMFEDFNVFNNEFYRNRAMHARSMKNAVAEVSSPNNYLRQTMEATFGYNPQDRKVKDIENIISLTEQKVISTKHITNKRTAQSIIPVVTYSEGLSKLASFDSDKNAEGLQDILDVYNTLGLFGKDFDLVTPDDIIGGTKYADLPTDIHKQLYTLNELFTNPKAKKSYNNIITNLDPNDKDGLRNLKNAWNENAEYIDTESGRNLKQIISDSTNISFLNIDDKQLGIGSIIESDGYEPYKIIDITKNSRDGFSSVGLEDLYSGETFNIVGDTFSDISNDLNGLGFKYTNAPDITTLNDVEFFDRRFASYDDFVRETIIEDTVGAFTNKQIHEDKYSYYEAIQNQFEKFNLDETQRKAIQDDIMNLSAEQKDLYRKSYSSKTKDIYFETENLINELRLTNTMTPNEVLSVANEYYKTTKVDLTEEMNNSIRQQAIHERKRRVYKDNIHEQHYSNIESYIGVYENKSKNNPMPFKGSTSIRDNRKSSLINTALNSLTFEQLGDIEVDYNGSNAKLSSINIEEVVDIAFQKTEKSKQVSHETIEKAKYYLSKIDTSNANQNSYILNNKLGSIGEIVQDAQNSAIKDMAKQTTKQSDSTLVKKTIDYVKNNKTKSAIIAGATIGLASAIVGKVNKQSPLIAKNNSQEEVDEQYATRDTIRDIAPRSNKNVVIQSSRGSRGVNYNISSLNNGSADNDRLLSNLRGLIGNNTNLRYKEEREERQINESWLKEKLSNIF